MLESMPLSLVVATTLLMGFVHTHQRHMTAFGGSSLLYQATLCASCLLGIISSIGLFIFYGLTTTWYMPIALFAVCIISSGILFGVLDAKIGTIPLSMASFLWPVAGYFMYAIVSSLRTLT